MSRMQQCYFCDDIVEPEYFLHPEDDVKDYLVNACCQTPSGAKKSPSSI